MVLVDNPNAPLESEVDRLLAKFNEVKNCDSEFARWDGYVIGGRWDGRIRGLDPDRRIGKRTEAEELADNAIRVSAMPTPLPDECVPHVLVTPDGEWHEHGTSWPKGPVDEFYQSNWLGYWPYGTYPLDPEFDVWAAKVRSLLAKYRTAVAVGVDAHV